MSDLTQKILQQMRPEMTTASAVRELPTRLVNEIIDKLDRLHKLESALAAEREKVRELVAAVEALPVEDMVERDQSGEPELIGYCMQAQGEWDRVRAALANTALDEIVAISQQNGLYDAPPQPKGEQE